MDLTSYFIIVKNEQSTYKYLSKKCLKNGHRFCPRCKQRKLYKLADKRRRCSRCKYTFHDFSGRWINHGRFSCVKWLHLIKLFELEASVRKMAEQYAEEVSFTQINLKVMIASCVVAIAI
jgi:transposase